MSENLEHQASEGEFFRRTVEQANVAICHADPEGNFIYVNDFFCDWIGYRREQLLEMGYSDITHPEDLEKDMKLHKQLLETDKAYHLQKRYIREDQSIIWGDLSVKLIRDDEGNPHYNVAIVKDITELKNTEHALAKAKSSWEQTFNSIHDMVAVVDGESKVVRMNDAMYNYFSKRENDPGEGSHCSEFFPGLGCLEGNCPHAKVLEGGDTHSVEFYDENRKANLKLTCSPYRNKRGEVVGSVHLVQDISQLVSRSLLEKQQSVEAKNREKLESLSTMAAGISHDFNNIFTGVVGNLDLLEDTLRSQEERTLLEEIRAQVDRATGLCRQMLAYAGQGAYEKKEIDTNQYIRNNFDFFEKIAGPENRLKLDLTQEPYYIKADLNQLTDALSELLVNAREATTDKVGLIVIKTRDLWIARHELKQWDFRESISPGPHIRISVVDNGVGMDQQVLSKSIEPFYTTKFLGRGLGLSSADGIARANGGCLYIESEPGSGTECSLIIPYSQEQIEEYSTTKKLLLEFRGSGRILIIDDEIIVRKITGRHLQKAGFEVSEVESGLLAVDLVQKSPHAFKVIVLDMLMEGMNGFEAFQAIREINPTQPILVSTGLDKADGVDELVKLPNVAYLKKPYRRRELLTKIKDLLKDKERS